MAIIYILTGVAIGFLVTVLVYLFQNKNIKSLYAENIILKDDINKKSEQITNFIIEKEQLKSELMNREDKLVTQKTEITNLREELNKEFKLLANEIFEEKTQKFSQINEERLQNILNPLKENINKFEKKVEDAYNSETREKASLKKELEQIISINKQMSDEAQKLTMALKGDKKLQGNWGEMQLEQILEKSGLEKGVHYQKQESFHTGQGERVIPDYVINLPENKNYIIDSKVSLVNYERFFNSETEEDKALYHGELIRDIKKHIDGLSRKNYQNLTNTPDFVFMFFAFESALFSAIQSDNTLFEYAFRRNIILVSTTTLLASLRTVSFIWTQENQKNNVMEIAKLGSQLYDKFVGFLENMTKVGRGLDQAKETYQDAMNQLFKKNANGSNNAGTIIGMSENLKLLGAKPSKNIPQSIIDRAIKEESEDI